jgi:NIMA (never in mitosis gene a)-related kinase
LSLDNLNSNQRSDITNEALLLSKLSHENIVKYYDSFINNEDNTLNIVMEYCDAGDLNQYITAHRDKAKKINIETIYSIFIQICKGIECLHSKRILHRDIKPLNIFLFKDGRAKIGDLGVAKAMTFSSYANTFVGTPYYLSPEICEEKPYNEKSDIWSLGCILYEMICLRKPFDGANPASVITKIAKGKYDPLDTKLANKEIINLVTLILEKNIKKRYDIQDILQCKTCHLI